MVALKAAQASSFIHTPATGYSAALVYGPDASLVGDHARTLARQVAGRTQPEAEIVRIDDRDLTENPDRLAIELKTQSMFAEHRVVHVKAERRLSPANLKELLAEASAAYLIVEAGNLRPGSPLRKLFEQSGHAVALPCYSDTARDIGALIESEFAGAGIRLSSETRAYLAGRLGGDLALARSECAKLALYAGGEGELAIDDIDAVIGEMGPGLVDALANAAAEGRGRDALRQLDALMASGQSTHMALAALNRHFQRLHHLCAGIEAGEPARTAVARFRPPLHFRQRDALLAQARNWSGTAAAKALGLVHEATRKTRLTPALEIELTEKLLLDLSEKKI